jgi:hypothetical protein
MKDAKFSITPVPHPPALMHCAAVAALAPAKLKPATKAIGMNLFMSPSLSEAVI